MNAKYLIYLGTLIVLTGQLCRGAGWSYWDDELMGGAKFGSNSDVVKSLQKGANINIMDQYRRTPLKWAILNDHKEIAGELLKRGADTTDLTEILVKKLNKWGFAVVHRNATQQQFEYPSDETDFFAEKMSNDDIMYLTDFLDDESLSKMASLNSRFRDIITYARGHKLLKKFGGERAVNGTFYDAVRTNKLWAIDFLLKHGANVNDAYCVGETALMTASGMGYSELVARLLAEGADFNAASQAGLTALMDAAEAGHLTIVNQLLQAGADVNAVSAMGTTALMFAVDRNNVDSMPIIQALLERGAIRTITNRAGQTALDIARQKIADVPRIMYMTEEKGAEIIKNAEAIIEVLEGWGSMGG